jgi:TPR repeat protein
VNLRDFFGESDHKKLWRTASIYAEAIEAIQKTRKKQKIAIIWTAWDLYERHVNRQGGIKKYLLEGENGLLVFFQNAIDDAIRAGCVIESFMVAPVEAVELPSDNSTTGKSVPHNPMVISIPKKGFKSPGLKQISAWIAQTVREQVEQDAKNNDPDALCTMGRRYIYGYGALKNEHEGFKIFHRLATEFKYPYAMYCLAHFYYFGQGVRQDKKEAHKWFKQAVESGSINAKDRLRELYKNGEEEFLKIEFDEMTKFVMASKFEIKERDAKIENLNAKITNLNIQVEDLNTKIAVKEDEVSTANNRLAECIEQWYKLFKNICGWFFWKRLFFWKATVKKEYESTVDEEFRP